MILGYVSHDIDLQHCLKGNTFHLCDRDSVPDNCTLVVCEMNALKVTNCELVYDRTTKKI